MSSDWLFEIVLLAVLLIMVMVISINVAIVKRNVRAFDFSSVMLFMTTFARFGRSQVERWKRETYDEREARLIVKYQLLCYVEISLGVVIVVFALPLVMH